MANMKIGYIIVLLLLATLAVAFVYLVLASPLGSHSQLEKAIQSAGVFTALLAAVVALAAVDPKRRSIKAEIAVSVNQNHVGTYGQDQLSEELRKNYDGFPIPLKSHRVEFKIKNVSGFTLKSPTLTFRLPMQKQHPHIVPGQLCNKRTFHSNLFNSQQELRLLELADTQVLSNSNLPYWNEGDEVTIWIRMILDDGKRNPFDVEVSVNSSNADGKTQTVKIHPAALVESSGPRLS